MFFNFQPILILATLGSLGGFCTMTGVDSSAAWIMVGLAVSLMIAIIATGRSDHAFAEPVSPI